MAKQRKFACHICNHKFAQIRKHIKRMHDNIQKLACDDCNYATHFSADMRNHIASAHDKIRNHTCRECGKSFFKRSVMGIYSMSGLNKMQQIVKMSLDKKRHHKMHHFRMFYAKMYFNKPSNDIADEQNQSLRQIHKPRLDNCAINRAQHQSIHLVIPILALVREAA